MTDANGYPTDEELKFIEEFKFTFNDKGRVNNVQELMDYIYDIWWSPDWGWKDEIIDADLIPDKDVPPVKIKRLHISTGGWSGNEDIINALENNQWFYRFFWKQSERGGHYSFEWRVE
jgi:hypothetical protein